MPVYLVSYDVLNKAVRHEEFMGFLRDITGSQENVQQSIMRSSIFVDFEKGISKLRALIRERQKDLKFFISDVSRYAANGLDKEIAGWLEERGLTNSKGLAIGSGKVDPGVRIKKVESGVKTAQKVESDAKTAKKVEAGAKTASKGLAIGSGKVEHGAKTAKKVEAGAKTTKAVK